MQELDLGSVVGPQGPKGDKGDPGPQGPAGPMAADGAKIAVGTYVGDGAASRTLSFSFEPQVVFVSMADAGGSTNVLFMQKPKRILRDLLVGGERYGSVTWTNNAVTWETEGESSAYSNMNAQGETYYYFVLGT